MSRKSEGFKQVLRMLEDQNFPKPLTMNQINATGYQSELEMAMIRLHSISFDMRDIADLTQKEIWILSDALAKKFSALAVRYQMRILTNDQFDLTATEANGILHELAHYIALKEIRPDFNETVTLNFLPVTADGKFIHRAANISFPITNLNLTIQENAKVILAPNYPSDSDYQDISGRIKTSNPTADDLNYITALISVKPESLSKLKFLMFLRSLSEA